MKIAYQASPEPSENDIRFIQQMGIGYVVLWTSAEKIGIRMSMHPADPQVDVIQGISRIMNSVTDHVRLLVMIPDHVPVMATEIEAGMRGG